MTAQHHPSEALLLDYASGSLGEACSLAIATHLALCPDCRRNAAQLEAIGGAFVAHVEFETETAVDSAFDAVMARSNDPDDTPLPATPPATAVIPEPLRRYLGGDVDRIAWQRLGVGAQQYVVPTADRPVTARLLRIPAGRPVPTHTHGGLELTLVLSGAFSDATGVYGRGDLQEADETLEHRPHAAAGEDCICLAVTDAPLRFRSVAARMVQPLLGI